MFNVLIIISAFHNKLRNNNIILKASGLWTTEQQSNTLASILISGFKQENNLVPTLLV